MEITTTYAISTDLAPESFWTVCDGLFRNRPS